MLRATYVASKHACGTRGCRVPAEQQTVADASTYLFRRLQRTGFASRTMEEEITRLGHNISVIWSPSLKTIPRAIVVGFMWTLLWVKSRISYGVIRPQKRMGSPLKNTRADATSQDLLVEPRKPWIARFRWAPLCDSTSPRKRSTDHSPLFQ